MSNGAKIHLSKYETEVVTDTKWILTKQAIIEKIYTFFGEIHDTYKAISRNEKANVAEPDFNVNGKISRGENYLGLPYIILDYPASFKKDDVIAIRTMFWWGNFFSITLHISGQRRMESIRLTDLHSRLKKKGFFICINEKEWHHNFDGTNYVAMDETDKKQWTKICSKKFLKISKKISITEWHEVPKFLETSYRELIDIIAISFPAGEKAL